MKKPRRGKEGMTLVELIVSLALMSILTVMVIGVVSPAAKTFARMQRIQFAQLILDNVEDEIRSQLLDAAGSVKIYDVSGGDVTGKPGADRGGILEYLNTDSYIVLMSADGCGETVLMRSGQVTGTEAAKGKGRLLLRYYWQTQAGSAAGGAYKYAYTEGGKLAARAVQQLFTDGYYMGNYLKLEFSFPDGIDAGTETDYIRVHAELYRDEERTDLLTSEDFVAELRYQAERIDEATASAE